MTQFPDEQRIRSGGGVDIRVAGVGKAFGDAAALHDVSLDVQEGELMALLGPSGSGKTTLLRVIAGLEIAEQGQVFFGGDDATNLPVQKRQVGFVFQHYALFRHLTVFDNIAYGLRARERARRPSSADIKQRVGDLLDLVQLDGYAHRFPAQLSGGQRQRVALARALAVEPRVLLLDEPFGALDAKVRKDLRRWLRDIHDRTGRTTIFVTHDQDEALELADRVAILNAGRVEQIGTPDEVQDRPASAFVMSFIGDAARIPVRVQGGMLWVADHALPIVPPAGVQGDAELFSRPWQLRLVDPKGAILAGDVRAVRRAGRARRAEVQIAPGLAIEVEIGPESSVAAGQATGVAIDGGHVFPK